MDDHADAYIARVNCSTSIHFYCTCILSHFFHRPNLDLLNPMSTVSSSFVDRQLHDARRYKLIVGIGYRPDRRPIALASCSLL